MRFTCAARTDVGIVRSGNEDNYLMLSDRGLFIVADGMGGHAAGEVASEMAVRLIAREVGSLKGLDNDEASRPAAPTPSARPMTRSSPAHWPSTTSVAWGRRPP